MLAQRNRLTLWQKLGRIWCSLMHSSTTWPIHGEYCCQRCGRRFSVPWADSFEFERSAIMPRRPQLEVVSRRLQVAAHGPKDMAEIEWAAPKRSRAA